MMAWDAWLSGGTLTCPAHVRPGLNSRHCKQTSPGVRMSPSARTPEDGLCPLHEPGPEDQIKIHRKLKCLYSELVHMAAFLLPATHLFRVHRLPLQQESHAG